jgi:coenzyme F420 hydrogenase subunit beta
MSDLLESIVTSGQCHGCGGCAAAIGSAGIQMKMTPQGYLRPVAARQLNHAEEKTLRAVCSGRELTQPRATNDGSYHKVWGPLQSVETGFSTDPDVRYRGSSGGVISAISLFLLESGAVEFILQTSADPNDPIGNVTRISSSRQDILDAAGSRYAPSSPLADLEKYLSMGKRFAFVGKPCDVATLRKMELTDSRIADLIPYKLAFFCAGVPSRIGTHKVLEKLGVPPSELAEFAYRGRGWPGLTRARRHDGTEESMDYNSSWGTILNRHLQFRCKVCVDGIGEFADIACADAWYGKDGYPDFTEQEGRSLIVARTDAGRQLVALMRSQDKLVSEALDADKIGEMQPYQKERRRAVLARLLGVALKGRKPSRYWNFGLLSLTVRSSPLWLLRNVWGTFKRTPFKGPMY